MERSESGPGREGSVIAPEGLPFIAAAAAATILLWGVWPRSAPVTLAALLVTAWVAWFFRNPVRTPPAEEGVVVSPADGRIVFAGDVGPGLYNDGPALKVSVFMNVFDVHVNRAPVSGKVVAVRYNPGRFHVASVEKASLENEQNGVVLETPGGDKVAYVQIAGLIARRIVCDLSEGDAVRRGQRVGMIRFGSRVDVYFPPGGALRVSPGDRVRAGESVLGVMP
jgi:phosphatidylserine decarboxylase